jgi:hypothetical protein
MQYLSEKMANALGLVEGDADLGTAVMRAYAPVILHVVQDGPRGVVVFKDGSTLGVLAEPGSNVGGMIAQPPGIEGLSSTIVTVCKGNFAHVDKLSDMLLDGALEIERKLDESEARG